MTGVHVIVRIGAERYAFAIEEVLEVSELGAVTAVAGALPGMLGLKNLHGSLLPVLDLATLLGMAPGGKAERLVVVEHGHIRAGLAVDEVCDVEALPEESQETDSPLLSSAALTADGLVGVVDLERLLGDLETAAA